MSRTRDDEAAVQARSVGGAPSRWLAAAGAFALAVVVRGLNHPAVITSEGVRPFGADAYYHLRRIQWDLLHFPQHLSFDPYLAPPAGGHSIWTPAFDWLLAALALGTVGSDNWAAAERLLVWVPPLLGGATVVVLHALAYPRFGPRVAGLAAVLLALLPAHAYYSQIGFVDHHSAVAFSSTLLFLCVSSFLRRTDASGRPGRDALAVALLLGLLVGASFLLWPGSLLHVGAVEVALLCSILGTCDTVRAHTRARLLTLTHTVAFTLVLPFCLQPEGRQWSVASPVVLSYFQPWLLASATICFGVLGFFRRHGASDSRLQRALLALMAGSLCLGVTLLMAPGSGKGALDALAWFSRSESFQVVVNESQPLSRNPGRALAHLSGFIFVAPLLMAALALSARGDRRAAERWTIAWWGLVLFAATLAQWRFFNSFSPPFALLVAWGWIGLHALVTHGLAASSGKLRVGVHAATAAAAIALLWPARTPFQTWLANYSPEPVGLYWKVHSGELIKLASWLRNNSPETSGYLDVGKRPEYTVLGAWGDGHVLRYVSRRAPITDNFGNDVSASNFEAAERYFAARSEDEALAVIAPLAVRYVVVRRSGSGHRKAYAPSALYHRLYQLGGSAGGLSFEGDQAPRRVAALTRHRQIYTSAQTYRGQPLFRVFEIVAGARVVGETEAGAPVVALLLLRGARDELLLYQSLSYADDKGLFELRLPHATDRASGEFTPVAPYEIRSGNTSVSVLIPERSVQRGETISVLDLRPG